MHLLYCDWLQKKKTIWASTGFNSWNKASERIMMHETSFSHIENCLKIKLEDRCILLIPSILKIRNEFIATNRIIVEAIIDIILYLTRHSLALREHKENWSDSLRENFKNLVILLGKNHLTLATCISGHKKKNKNMYDFTSWRRQNQLIDSLASFTRHTILK